MNNNKHASQQPTSASGPAVQMNNDVANKLNTPSYDIALRSPEELRNLIHDGVSNALRDDGHFRHVIRQLDKAY